MTDDFSNDPFPADLVERLRDGAGADGWVHPAVAREAADEIERLRAKLAEAVSCLERGAYDLRLGGYLRSATILEECTREAKP